MPITPLVLTKKKLLNLELFLGLFSECKYTNKLQTNKLIKKFFFARPRVYQSYKVLFYKLMIINILKFIES